MDQNLAVLFDLDGTLVNSLPDISRCMNAALQRHGLPPHPEAAYRRMTGNGARVLAQRAVGEAHSALADAVLADYSALYAAHCYDASHVYPGVDALLNGLRQAGLRLAVLSNKDDGDVKSVMAHYFPAAPFDILRGRLPGVPLKPDPAAALSIAREMGVAPSRFWYLGDTPTDCETARAAGMRFIAAGWGFCAPETLRQAGARPIAATAEEALSMMLFAG